MKSPLKETKVANKWAIPKVPLILLWPHVLNVRSPIKILEYFHGVLILLFQDTQIGDSLDYPKKHIFHFSPPNQVQIITCIICYI